MRIFSFPPWLFCTRHEHIYFSSMIVLHNCMACASYLHDCSVYQAWAYFLHDCSFTWHEHISSMIVLYTWHEHISSMIVLLPGMSIFPPWLFYTLHEHNYLSSMIVLYTWHEHNYFSFMIVLYTWHEHLTSMIVVYTWHEHDVLGQPSLHDHIPRGVQLWNLQHIGLKNIFLQPDLLKLVGPHGIGVESLMRHFFF